MEGSGQGGSNVNPLALLFLITMSFVILGSSRQNAAKALLATAGLIPLGQQIVLAGLHLHFLRILILVGFIRLFSKRETIGFKLLGVDKMFIYWVLTGFVCTLLRDPPTAETFGMVYNEMGTYFLVRMLVRDGENAVSDLRIFAWLGIIVGACMLLEVFTHRNPFFIFGGVPEITIQRGDRFRCQGPFRHPILAGTFGATLLPLMVGLWLQGGKGKWLALFGIVGGLIITVSSASSGPVLTVMAVMIGFGVWGLRYKMYLVRWSIVSVFVVFALVMNAPVWYLIAKVSDLVGGGGWHRSYLIDQFVGHTSEWWLKGTSYTAHWAPAGEVLEVNPNMMDITNHYVVQGITGGIWMFVLFIAIITGCFKIIGRSMRSDVELPFDRKLAWAFGVCLASHVVAFISVSYFDQMSVFWIWLLAVISGLSIYTSKEKVQVETDESEPEATEEGAEPVGSPS
jgi:hypothetical protein